MSAKLEFREAPLKAAILTQSYDAVSQLAMATPMMVLCEGGILASRIFLRMRASPVPQKE